MFVCFISLLRHYFSSHYMKRLLVILLMLFSVQSNAQLQGRELLDSLVSRLLDVPEDTSKIKLLNSIADAYKTIDPDKGIKYGFKQLELAQMLHQKTGEAAAYIVIGVNYHHKSDYIKALEYFNKALAFYADFPGSGIYGTLISHLAVVYQEMGNLDKALEYNKKALELDLKLKDSTNIGGDYGNIGIIYLLKKNYEKALEYDLKSLAIFEGLKDKDGIARNYGNLGNLYKEYGDYGKALEYDIKALNMFSELGDKAGIAINLGNIGGVYLQIVKEKDAASHTGQPLPKGNKVYFLAKAIDHLQKAIALSKEIGQLDNIIEFSEGLHEAYMLTGNHAAALESYKQYVLFKDSVYSQENKLKIAGLEMQREMMLKDKEIQIEQLEVAQKRNQRIILLITIVLLLVVIGVVVRKFLAQKRYAAQLDLEKSRHLARIEKQKIIMGDISRAHSHEVSGQVATILGLVDVFNAEDYTDPDNKVVLDGIAETAARLDIIVKDMIVKENHVNSEHKAN